MYQPDPPGPAAPAALQNPIAILGGGVAGLAAAHRLTRAGVAVKVFEVSARLGGVVRSHNEDGWLSEGGPNSFQENSRRVMALLQELGLDSEKVYANAAARKRFLVRDRRVLPVPGSPVSFLTTPLFSFLTKGRILSELWKSPRARKADVSLADFVEDHFGAEVVKFALNPFVSGVYAGDASRLSARLSFPSLWKAEATHGSLLRGLGAQSKEKRHRGEPKARILSFRGGLQALPEALARSLPAGSTCLRARVTRLVPGLHGAPWRVFWDEDGIERSEPFRAVISTLPAHALARLEIGPGALRPLADLSEVVCPPVTSLFLGYRREQVQHPLDGFGVLIPACEKSPLLGVLFSSTLFPERAPAGHVALTVMIGGTLHPELPALDDADLMAQVKPELAALLGVAGDPVLLRRTTWPTAIPQYNVGYEKFIGEIETCEHTFAGLHIGGQLRHGISLPQCLEAGLDLAERVLR